MSALSEFLMVSNGNVTGVVSRLIEDGLVTRTVDRADRRSATVRLTRKGREAFLKMAAANERWMDNLFADLSAAQIEALMRLLSQVRRSIDAHAV
jgi:DNA-binding MarR family transcriptional regulator